MSATTMIATRLHESLVYFEGHLSFVAISEEGDGKLYFCQWIDVLNDEHAWACVETTAEEIEKLKAGEVSLRSMLEGRPTFGMDRNGILTPSEPCPAELLPDPDTALPYMPLPKE